LIRENAFHLPEFRKQPQRFQHWIDGNGGLGLAPYCDAGVWEAVGKRRISESQAKFTAENGRQVRGDTWIFETHDGG